MDWVTQLINGIPQIIQNIAPGFFLMASFSWATSSSITDGKTIIIISATLSYLINQLTDLLKIGNTSFNMILICVIAALVGVIIAIIYKSELFNNCIANIRIKRTTNKSIWDDAVGEGAWVALLNADTNQYYCGRYQYQNYENEKCYLVLSTYYVADLSGNIVSGKDYTSDIKRKLMVDPDSYKQIIISSTDPFNHYEI